ncbi:MAG: TraB/GumN family protein, partial [Candidatus Methanomethylophilaceae archaeon]|nr:TraB/GumN family protein [Candidatus Methanomethylophilaceae archaeon]
IADMRRKYPTLVRKLIDERNELMARQIRSYSEKYDKIVVVCGDAHVEGISSHLPDLQIKKIRLRDITDKQRLDKLRSEAWNHDGDSE